MIEFLSENLDWIVPSGISALALSLSILNFFYTRKVKKESVRFQLHSKRYELYDKLCSLYDDFFNQKQVTHSFLTSFKETTAEASLFFSKDIIQCCNVTANILYCYSYKNSIEFSEVRLLIKETQKSLDKDYYTACEYLIKEQQEKLTTLVLRELDLSKYKVR